MPFTPIHTLAVVPFTKRLPTAALFIGAMVPDTRLFAPHAGFNYEIMHSASGAITHCLPLALVLYLIFHYIMKAPLLALLPRKVSRRLPGENIFWSTEFAAKVCCAILLGVFSHIIWDSFSHHGRLGTQIFPILLKEFPLWGSKTIAGYKIVQYGSTLIGGPLLIWLLANYLVNTQHRALLPKYIFKPNFQVLVLVVTIAFVCLATSIHLMNALYKNIYYLTYIAVTRSGYLFFNSMLLYCLLFHAYFCHQKALLWD